MCTFSCGTVLPPSKISSSCRSDCLYVNSFLEYSNSNHIFKKINKHNPFSGPRAYLRRLEVVILQTIQSIMFKSSMPGLLKFFVLRSQLKNGFSMRPPWWIV